MHRRRWIKARRKAQARQSLRKQLSLTPKGLIAFLSYDERRHSMEMAQEAVITHSSHRPLETVPND